MRLIYMFCSRAVRCIFVAFFVIMFIIGAASALKCDMVRLQEPQNHAAAAARVSRDRIFGKELRLPVPVAALTKKESLSNANNLVIFSSRMYINKIERILGFLPQAKNQAKTWIYYYIFYLLGVLFLLKKQSVITYLHKRNTASGKLCLFAF